MSGWVYIITNRAMSGLIKVGFTEREPGIRAKEMDGTGLPTPYAVAYAVEVEKPRVVERETHVLLNRYHYGKEWFRCSIKVAREAITTACSTYRYQAWNAEAPIFCDSPLIPGHALAPYFQSLSKPVTTKKALQPTKKHSDHDDANPLPPGHPLRDFL